MAYTFKQLAQTRPTGTTAASIYSPATSTSALIRELVVCNTTGTAATFRVFIDDNGTTYDQTTALWYDVSVAANATTRFTGLYITMNDSTGNLAVRTGTASALTFTVFGVEVT